MFEATETLRKAHHLPEGWQPVRLEALGDNHTHVMVTGAVYPEKIKLGPRKGRTNFNKPVDGTQRKIVLSNAEYRAWLNERRIVTGGFQETAA